MADEETDRQESVEDGRGPPEAVPDGGEPIEEDQPEAVESVSQVPISSNYKVLGETNGADRIGVLGENKADSGRAYGVYGLTRSRTGVGVYGLARKLNAALTFPAPVGVRGVTRADGDAANNNAPVAVHGRATGNGIVGGVLGQANSRNGLGVSGSSAKGSVGDILSLLDSKSYAAGTLGFTDKTTLDAGIENAFGVIGLAVVVVGVDGASNVGVFGQANPDEGYGVFSNNRLFASTNTSVKQSDTTPGGYVARFVDQDTEPTSSQAIIDAVTRDTDSGSNVKYFRFLEEDSNGNSATAGYIEGTGSSGITLNSVGADLAEYFPKADPDEDYDGGTVVGLSGGEITRDLADAERAAVISEAPMVSGNMPRDADDQDDYARIALVGQVDVDAGAPVTAGDLLVAAGDGTAVPRSEHDGATPLIVGIALDGAEAGERVPTLVGGTDAAATPTGTEAETPDREEVEELRETVEAQQETIERLEARLNELERTEQPAPADD